MAGVADRVTFVQGHLFELDVVSHAFDMGNCRPEKTAFVAGKEVYFWTVPARRATQARTGE